MKHILTTYLCVHCLEAYSAAPETELWVLRGTCWACAWLDDLSASKQDNYLAELEANLGEDYDI